MGTKKILLMEDVPDILYECKFFLNNKDIKAMSDRNYKPKQKTSDYQVDSQLTGER